MVAGSRQNDRSLDLHRWLRLALQVAIAAGLAVELYQRRWTDAVIVFGILLLTIVPSRLARRMRVRIPAQLELLLVIFVFAALFLGETRGYYARFWWWDIALHIASGMLLGILGILLVYILNETPRIDLSLRPGFVACFAFLFAVTGGAMWEVFEFAMDQLFGLTMQKPMLGDDSGLTDTMVDLIGDIGGALIATTVGYWCMKRRIDPPGGGWIRRFIETNPRFFRRRSE